jgi:triphosphoribosyl-dephospho-CoA synthase
VTGAFDRRPGVTEDTVARAFVAACEAELDAPKPGNVHRFAPGHGMEAADFVKSARAAAPFIAAADACVGARILGAVEATWAAVNQNTNLDRKSTRLNSSHNPASRMPSSA